MPGISRSIIMLWAAIFVPLVAISQRLSWKDINGLPGCYMLREAANGKLFAVTDPVVYYSTDGGTVWLRTSIDRGSVTELVCRNDQLVVARDFALYFNPYQVHRSTDNGLTWNRILASTSDNAYYYHLMISDSGIILGGTYVNQRYTIVRYGPQNWQTIGNPTFIVSIGISDVRTTVIDRSNNIYLGTQDYGLVYSTDYGDSWQKTLPWRIVNAMTVAYDNTLIVSASPTGIMTSTDAASTWSKLGLANSGRAYAVSSDSSGNICVATSIGIYYYVKDSEIWEDISPKRDNYVDVLITASGEIVATNSSVIYRSLDKGATWRPSGPRDQQVFSIITLSSGEILAGTLGGGIFRSTSGGSTWDQSQPGPVPDYVYSFSSRGPIVYAGTDSGLYETTDKGISWKNITSSYVTGSSYSVVVAKSGEVFTGTNFGVYASSDAGNTWVLSGMPNYGVLFLAADSMNGVYAVTEKEGIFATRDNGTSWVRCGLVREDIQSIAASPSGDLYVGVYRGIFRSNDYGASWIQSTFTSGYVYSIVSGPANMILAGTYNNVMVSYNGGVKWDTLGLDGECMLSLGLTPGYNLIGGTNGDGIYQTTKQITLVAQTPAAVFPASACLKQNYPNPFNSSTTIGYTLQAGDNVSLIIYDLLGRVVKILVDGYEQPGYKTVKCDAGGLPSGIYFCRLQAGKSADVKKILIAK